MKSSMLRKIDLGIKSPEVKLMIGEYRAFSHAMLVNQTNPVELFSYVNAFLCSNTCSNPTCSNPNSNSVDEL